MSDDAISGELIDLQGLSLSELLDEIHGSEIETALDRLFSDSQLANSEFNNFI